MQRFSILLDAEESFYLRETLVSEMVVKTKVAKTVRKKECVPRFPFFQESIEAGKKTLSDPEAARLRRSGKKNELRVEAVFIGREELTLIFCGAHLRPVKLPAFPGA